jgi:hypothetical protein
MALNAKCQQGPGIGLNKPIGTCNYPSPSKSREAHAPDTTGSVTMTLSRSPHHPPISEVAGQVQARKRLSHFNEALVSRDIHSLQGKCAPHVSFPLATPPQTVGPGRIVSFRQFFHTWEIPYMGTLAPKYPPVGSLDAGGT